MRAMIKVKQALCWKCKYLFQSLSVEAACLIDCTTTDCMCMHFIVLVKRSQVYMHKYILTENINCFGLSPLSPLSIIWFSSVNKSNYKWPLILEKTSYIPSSFNPGNSTKLCDITWKFQQGQKPRHMEIPHKFSNTPVEEIPFLTLLPLPPCLDFFVAQCQWADGKSATQAVHDLVG